MVDPRKAEDERIRFFSSWRDECLNPELTGEQILSALGILNEAIDRSGYNSDFKLFVFCEINRLVWGDKLRAEAIARFTLDLE